MGQTRSLSLWIVLLLAVGVGLVYFVPHVVQLLWGDNYNPLEPTVFGPDEALYTAGVREVLEGNFLPSDLAVVEHKEESFFYPPLPFMVMALFTVLVGGVFSALIMADVVFSALAFFLFYVIARRLLKSDHLAVVCSLVFVFFYRFFIPVGFSSFSSVFDHVVHNLFYTGGTPAYLWFARFVHPQIPMVLFLGFLGVLFVAFEQRKRWQFLTAGLLFGLMFYSYFYLWTFVAAFLGILFVVLYVQKKKTLSMSVLFSGIVGVIVGIPYLIHFYFVSGADLALRSGVEVGRFVEPISVVYAVLVVLLIVFTRIRNNAAVFLASLMAAGIVALNVQLLFGYTVQNNHWNSRIIVSVLILLFFYGFSRLLHFFRATSYRVLFWPVVILLFTMAIHLQVQEVISVHDAVHFSPAEQQLLDWMSNTFTPDDVLLSSDLRWNVLIPAYTAGNVYFPYGAMTLSSDEEMQERFVLTYKFLGKSVDEVQKQLTANSAYTRSARSDLPLDKNYNSFLRSYIFVDTIYPVKVGVFRKMHVYNSTLVDALIMRYEAEEFSVANLFKYKVDYVLLVGDERKLQSGLVNDLRQQGYNMTMVFENDEFVMLEINV